MNIDRLKECMRRAERGEELTLGFFGGSITQDSAASIHENCYTRRVFRWWEKNFPAAKFNYINAGVGGTSSHFGAARVQQDLLVHNPDFVIVDFSVNDVENELIQETYEGLLRQILSYPSSPAVILLNNIYYDTGYTDQDCHNEIGDWYGVPHVSIRDTIYRRMLEGEFKREELTPDGLHPNDKGHELVADEIIKLLQSVKADMDQANAELPLPEPLTQNAYEHAKRLNNLNSSAQLLGFKADTHKKADRLDHFSNGWIASKPGDSIRFEVEGSCIAIQYRKTIRHPALSATLVLDGDRAHPVDLNGNFEEDWGDCLYLQPVLHHGTSGKHTVEITTTGSPAQNATPFYLLSLITA